MYRIDSLLNLYSLSPCPRQYLHPFCLPVCFLVYNTLLLFYTAQQHQHQQQQHQQQQQQQQWWHLMAVRICRWYIRVSDPFSFRFRLTNFFLHFFALHIVRLALQDLVNIFSHPFLHKILIIKSLHGPNSPTKWCNMNVRC